MTPEKEDLYDQVKVNAPYPTSEPHLFVKADKKRMPILRAVLYEVRQKVPDAHDSMAFEFFADRHQRCLENHSQTPERLAERGGLSYCEAWAILNDKSWGGESDEVEALRKLRLAGAFA